jgi:hypothetical protein
MRAHPIHQFIIRLYSGDATPVLEEAIQMAKDGRDQGTQPWVGNGYVGKDYRILTEEYDSPPLWRYLGPTPMATQQTDLSTFAGDIKAGPQGTSAVAVITNVMGQQGSIGELRDV